MSSLEQLRQEQTLLSILIEECDATEEKIGLCDLINRLGDLNEQIVKVSIESQPARDVRKTIHII